MRKNVEQSDIEALEAIEAADQLAGDVGVQEELPMEERVDIALDEQETELKRAEAPHGKKTLSGLKQWVATAVMMGSSLLAVGCNAEKPSVENPDEGASKVESSDSGFTDNTKDVVEQRLKIKKAEIKHMKAVERNKNR